MEIRTATFDRLTDAEIAAWDAIQRGDSTFASPYFRPEFTQAVASVRADVEIAVLEEHGRPVGFFPFQRTSWGTGRPVAGRLSDFHAVIAPPDVDVDPLQLIAACGLSSWHFSHLIPVHDSLARFAWSMADSPYIDLTGGFDAYIAARQNGRRILSEFRSKRRRLEREIGPIRYESNHPDAALLAACIRWKSTQYDGSEADNVFRYRWVLDLLDRILAGRGDDFAPVVSATYVGQRLAVVNVGMRCRGVLHPWFPAYDRELADYSPGFIHWIETMQAASSLGITRIDLGKGDESYKKRLMTGVVSVAQGVVDSRPSVAAARRVWRSAQAGIKASPLYRPARVPARVLRKVRSWIELR